MNLRDRDAARVKHSLKNGKCKREGFGALECVRKKTCIGYPGTKARSKRDKRLQNFINDLHPDVPRKSREE